MRYTFSREANDGSRHHMQKVWNTKTNILRHRAVSPELQKGVRIIQIPKGYVYDHKKYQWVKPRK